MAVCVGVCVVVGVIAGVPDSEAAGVCVFVCVNVAVGVTVMLGVTGIDPETEGVTGILADGLFVIVGVGETPGVGL